MSTDILSNRIRADNSGEPLQLSQEFHRAILGCRKHMKLDDNNDPGETHKFDVRSIDGDTIDESALTQWEHPEIG